MLWICRFQMGAIRVWCWEERNRVGELHDGDEAKRGVIGVVGNLVRGGKKDDGAWQRHAQLPVHKGQHHARQAARMQCEAQNAQMPGKSRHVHHGRQCSKRAQFQCCRHAWCPGDELFVGEGGVPKKVLLRPLLLTLSGGCRAASLLR